MRIDQVNNGNWNYIHEWRKNNLESEWFPCHLISDCEPYKNYKCIFTRNGSIIRVLPENVRQMSEDEYIKCRESTISVVGKHFESHGFHEKLEEDLVLFRKS